LFAAVNALPAQVKTGYDSNSKFTFNDDSSQGALLIYNYMLAHILMFILLAMFDKTNTSLTHEAGDSRGPNAVVDPSTLLHSLSPTQFNPSIGILKHMSSPSGPTLPHDINPLAETSASDSDFFPSPELEGLDETLQATEREQSLNDPPQAVYNRNIQLCSM
jgi:hypothetical protein